MKRVPSQSVTPMTSSSSTKDKAPANTNNALYELPWYGVSRNRDTAYLTRGWDRVEKYRPQVLDDVVGNSDTIERLKVIARDGNVPHLIISVNIPLILSWKGRL